MKIKKKFLQLTRLTYPYGTEFLLENMLPDGFKRDKFDNYYISIGDNYSTMFTCHLDTSCSKMENITHKFEDNYIKTDGTTILGADDKAGMIVTLFMIEKKVPGLYYFFIGEEVGCVGSSDLSDELDKNGDVPVELKNIKKVISFDRRGTTSVITDQFYGTCCSDEFAIELCSQLNAGGVLSMSPDNTGVLTDSAQFMGIIPECTNISVGYYDEHTHKERQDIDFLYKLCNSVVKVDWESLPVKRDPIKFESFNIEDWEVPFECSYGAGYGAYSESFTNIKRYDKEYNEDLYSFVLKDGKRVKAYISQTWINYEILLIESMLKKQGRRPAEINWDGTTLWIREIGEHIREYVGSRSDLSEFIDKIHLIPLEHLKYEI